MRKVSEPGIKSPQTSLNLINKREAKMVGYWPSSVFLARLWTETEWRFTEQPWWINDLLLNKLSSAFQASVRYWSWISSLHYQSSRDLLAKLARAVLGNIGPRSLSVCVPSAARTVLPRLWVNISLALRYYLILAVFQIVGEMFAGDSFGELALLHGMKRAATIICKGTAEFLTVDKPDFNMVRGFCFTFIMILIPTQNTSFFSCLLVDRFWRKVINRNGRQGYPCWGHYLISTTTQLKN